MSRRQRKGISPSLFPFLAVLVCTLGTLILLLALVAQNATNAAEQTARNQQPEKPLPPRAGLSVKAVDSLLKEQIFLLEEQVSIREEQTNELGEKRDTLTYFDQQLASTRERLRQLNDEIQRLNDADRGAEIEEIDQQMLRTVLEQVDSEKKAIAKLREEVENQTPRIVIVPHKGPNGTDRTPIYIECTSTGVTIFPEGNRITLSQLERAAYSSNPLDAALRTVRLHTLGQHNDAVPPYPLLVVRPDGIEAYAAARSAMQDWDDQFGYELVPTDVELAYQNPDPSLKHKIDLAISQAVSEQQTLHSHASNSARGYGGQRPQGNPAATATSGQHGNRRLPILSAATLDREGRASGFRSQNDPANSVAAGRQTVLPSRAGYGNSTYPRQAGYGNRAPAGQQWQMDAGNEARQWAAKIQSATRDMEQVSKSQASRERSAGLLPPNEVSEREASDSTNATIGEEISKAGSEAVSQNHSHNLPDTFRDRTPLRSSSTTGSAQQSTDAGSENSSQESSVDQGRGQTGSMSKQTLANGNGGTQNAGSHTEYQSSQQLDRTQDKQKTPSRRLTDNQREPLSKDGKDWALPKRMLGLKGNAIVRGIRVECHPDHFVLLASGAAGKTEVFGFTMVGPSLEKATLQLAAAIRERIDRWGPALPGGRWEPQLQITIMPDSENRYRALQEVFRDSGIDIVGRLSE